MRIELAGVRPLDAAEARETSGGLIILPVGPTFAVLALLKMLAD